MEVDLKNVNYGIKGRDRKVDYDKWVDLDHLPKIFKGIDWKNCAGFEISFRYNKTYGVVKIVEYNIEKQTITIIFNDNIYNIKTSNFINCQLGRMLKETTREYKIEIGKHIESNTRDLKIMDRKRKGSRKYYKYKCNKCGFECGEHYKDGKLIKEYWIDECSLLRGSGCACCCRVSRISVENINSIFAKEKWMIRYFVDKDDAKKYTPNSNKKIYMMCPYCGSVIGVKKQISQLYSIKSIGCKKCSDGLSYPSKIFYNVLEQLGVKFETEYSPKWASLKRYDFYINDYNHIIEIHGNQHYNRCGESSKWNKLEKEQENDRFKRELASQNGIEYYTEIDCRRSTLEWVKSSILNSVLNELFDLSIVDWNMCEEYALNSLIKQVCDYWNNKEKTESVDDVAKIFKLSNTTIRLYLHKGTEIGLCDYRYEKGYIYNKNLKASKKSNLKKGNLKKEKVKRKGKEVEIFKDGVSLGIFSSCAELEKQSKNLFGVKLNYRNICDVANNKRKTHKGYTFKYTKSEKADTLNQKEIA